MMLHICPKKTWEEAKAKGRYEGDTLASQGFIHCSTRDQVIEVANYIYKGKKSLVLLVIDEEKVAPEIKYEGTGDGKLYPHIYGPLNINAVSNVLDFPPGQDGTFELPGLYSETLNAGE